ncbi:MAG: bifunctional phosphopantothenoylcysteine decarboxylase/phosphopantothenate--cysteine ligase CoaBC [Desulfovibrionaceae bacterium]
MSVQERSWAFSALEGRRLHLGVCGSVAAYRLLDVLRWWQKTGVRVSATLTPAAQKFVTPLSFEALGASPVYTEMFGSEAVFGHLEPGQVAQAMCIAPASASTLARLAHGQADSLLACQALAFDGAVVLAPAMNPRMWAHAATQANVRMLEQRGVAMVLPACGSTACGDEGQGKLADPREIYWAALRALAPQDMAGQHIMLTLGPTQECWDAVRHWTNPSTGTMGACLAMAAWLRGARVDAVCGPHCPWLPAGITRHEVGSAAEMYTTARALWPAASVGIFTAAVADFAPVPYGNTKFKKADAQAKGGLSIDFAPTVDILKSLAADRRPDQKVVGFAAETVEDLVQAARIKLDAKKAHMIVANPVNQVGSGFGAITNSVTVLDFQGRQECWPKLSKPDVAWKVCTWVLTL